MLNITILYPQNVCIRTQWKDYSNRKGSPRLISRNAGKSSGLEGCGYYHIVTSTQDDIERHASYGHGDVSSPEVQHEKQVAESHVSEDQSDFTTSEAEFDDQVEFDQVLWDVLLCEDDSKELTICSKKKSKMLLQQA